MRRIHTNQIAIRILGTLTGLGFMAVASDALLGGEGIEASVRARATGFGVAALVAGVWAVAVSWLDSDLTGVWCRPPRRWKAPGRTRSLPE